MDSFLTDFTTPLAILANTRLSLAGFLGQLRRRGLLTGLLREAAVKQFVVEEAKAAGLTVTLEELQSGADRFRRRHGLHTAEQTRAWLANQHLSADDFEAALENDLLIEKLKDRVAGGRVADHFSARQAGYAVAELRLILVPREDLGRELLAQHREGGDFAELAGEHSHHASRHRGGSIGRTRRRQLPRHVGDAVFAATPGDAVGPLAMPAGFALFLVDELLPAVLDADLTASIRNELFDAWLRDQLARHPVDFPLMEALAKSC